MMSHREYAGDLAGTDCIENGAVQDDLPVVIAFGNYRTFVALPGRDEEVFFVAGRDGDRYILSCSAFDDEGALIFGKDAASRLLYSKEKVLVGLHQLIPGVKDSVPEGFDGELVISSFFKEIKSLAEDQSGRKISGCVIALPSDFSKYQVDFVLNMARKAGLKNSSHIAECIATCEEFFSKRSELKPSQQSDGTICVVNIGCYRTETSIIRAEHGSYKILCTSSCPTGGNLIVEAMMNDVIKKFCADNKVKPEDFSAKSLVKLRDACESAKRTLATKVTAMVSSESLVNGIDCHVSISLSKVESICQNVFSDCLESTKDILKKAGVLPTDVSVAIITGTSTKLGKFKSIFESLFETDKLSFMEKPGESVIRGATSHASQLKEVPANQLEACCDKPFSAKVLAEPLKFLFKNGNEIPIFPKGTPIPNCKIIDAEIKGRQNTIYLKLADVAPIAEVVMNIDVKENKDGKKEYKLLVALEDESLIKISALSEDEVLDAVDVRLS